MLTWVADGYEFARRLDMIWAWRGDDFASIPAKLT
jgi:hypothetical protein